MNGTTHKAATEELYKAYDFFVKRFWKTEAKDIPEPIILITSRGRKAAYGWFWKDRWASGEGSATKLAPEIVIAAETFNRGPSAVLETLLHEIAHHWNSFKGVPDCNALQYHNKEFKKTAEFLGLNVDRMNGKGYALTSLGTEGQAAIDAYGPNAELYKFRCVSNEGEKKESKYITVTLKKEDYEDALAKLAENFEMESSSEVVRELVDNALAKLSK